MEVTEYGIGTRRSNMPTISGASSNFDYSTAILMEDTQKERMDGFVRPVGGVTETGPYNFEIPPVADAYLLMNKIALYVKAKITMPDGTDCADTELVAPVAGIGSVMWEHAEASLNDYSMSGARASNAHYKAYIESLLSYDAQAKETHLRAQMFIPDSPGKMETFNGVADANNGWNKRWGLTKGSKSFDLMGPITIDFLRSTKHLAPGNKLNIKLTRAQDRFLLCASQDKEYKLVIEDLRLYYHRVRLSENVAIPPTERYLMARTELKRFPVPTGQPSYNLTLFRGAKLPKSIILGQVLTSSAEGNVKQNPFNFRHFDLSRISLRLNGRRVPTDDYTPDFNKGLFMREYLMMFMNTGAYGNDRSNFITSKAYQSGSTLFAYDLTPDLCNSAHLHEGVPGELSVELHWKTVLAQPITVIALCIFDSAIIHHRDENEFTEEII